VKRHTRALLAFAALGAVAALIVPAVASAHVALEPSEAPAGAEMRLDVRVPNERDNAGTVRVALELPSGFLQASPESVPGWRVNIVTEKLAAPIQTDDGPVTEEVRRITWIGNGTTGIIRPGEFQDFGLAVVIPGKAGDTLTFKALQTYSNGEVVRWIGAPDSEEPAPQVSVVAATADAHGAAATADPAASTPAATSDDDDGASKGLAITALVVGILGLLAGGAALILTRRRPGSTA
jgi:periplasmic copper chaperone A